MNALGYLPLALVMAYVGGAAIAKGHLAAALFVWAIALGCNAMAVWLIGRPPK